MNDYVSDRRLGLFGLQPLGLFGLQPLGLAAVLLSLALAGPAEAEVDVTGSWFVLMHYRDSQTANPDSDRWEDKVWKIEKKGSRLQWTEYPIVVFNDGSGRFGRVGRNPRARLLRKWEPNDGQMAEIKDGVQVNSRGSKTKSLRGSPKRGFKSTNASRSTSALTVGYQETWSIDDPTTLPVFTRDDALGTESALATKGDSVVSGRTRYKTLEVLEGGDLLVGTYTRDENKKGTFQLIRASAPRGLESDGRTPNQKVRERQREAFRQGARDVAYSRFLQALGDETTRDLRGQLGEEKLTEIWQKYEARFIGEDESARAEITAELRTAYIESVKAEVTKAFLAGDPDALLNAREKGLEISPDQRELIRKVRESLGEEKIASLREEYAERIAAGDEKAREEFAEAIRDAYTNALEADFIKRLQAGGAEAMR
jgi:hypothetical protein